MSEVLYHLSDLNTAFPRYDSLRLHVQYTNGDEDYITTNHTLQYFTKQYLNANVRRSYYCKDLNAPICQISNIAAQ
jgi:hypothetical protein